ncbi:MAG: HIT family protein [Prevotellaceae bacterium]|jgi:histidine triad (HIT) family protein|nr:HIT family protein [Prevotellaceae bacterium]
MASIFTKIINGEIPSYKIAEDENCYAFLDINPVAKAHTLVVPKNETDYIFDVDDDTLGKLTVFAKRVAKAIEKSVECKRVGVVVLGLEVPHAHIHLIPLNNESDIDFKKSKLQLTADEFKQIAETISKNFV